VTTRRAQTSHESRELILAAAAELFAGKGYRQTTFVYVAMRSGISRGSIPWHFGSKQGLLLAVLERSMETFRTGLTEEPQGVEAGLRHLTSGVEALFAVPTTKLFEDILLPVEQPLNRDEGDASASPRNKVPKPEPFSRRSTLSTASINPRSGSAPSPQPMEPGPTSCFSHRPPPRS